MRLRHAFLFVVFASPAFSQTVVTVPNAYSASNAGSTFLGPLANAARTYQMLIHENQLTSFVGKNLVGLTFRLPTSSTNPWPATTTTYSDYEIHLSGSVAPANRSLTFAENIVGPQTQGRDGALTIAAGSFPAGGTPVPGGVTIDFSSWLYEGGHLLIEIRHSAFTGTSASNQAVAASSSGLGYGTDFSACWTSSQTGTTGSQGNFVVTDLVAAAVPEPGCLLLAGAVLAVGAGWRRVRRLAA